MNAEYHRDTFHTGPLSDGTAASLSSCILPCRYGAGGTQTSSLATLDKGKHDKQQKNGLSTLPKTPPGCKKGGVFA